MSIKAGHEAHRRGNKAQALEHYLSALDSDFNDADALLYAGVCYLELGKNGAAAQLLYRSLQINPDNAQALNSLGAAYKYEENWSGAEELWQMAFDAYQKHGDGAGAAGVLSNVGTTYMHRGDAARSIEFFNKALTIDPNCLDARANRCQANFWLGNWEEGWQDHEYHLRLGTRQARPYYDNRAGDNKVLPAWDGSPDRKPVVYGEQGIGDELMYGSIMPDLLKLCPEAVFDCHPRLVDTWKHSLGISCYGTRKSDEIAWFPKEMPDCAIAIGSLGKFFRNKREDFPGTPYLKPDPTLLEQFNRHRRGKPRIGISWKGGSKKTGRRVRSIPLDAFVPLLTSVDADWYSLQYHDDSGREIDKLEMETGIHVRHFPDIAQAENYDTTIAFTASLDLVITACTSILHASGGLGIPTYILTPWESAWRESGNDGQRGPDIPWYNSAKLFHRHQTDPDWANTMEMVRRELLARFSRKEAAE